MRRIPALVSSAAAVSLLAVGLTGCASAPDDISACTPLLPSGDTSALITATGEVGSEPSTDFATPLLSGEAERDVLVSEIGRAHV